MNRLSTRQRAQIISLLTEGMSIRAITRVQGVAKNTVMKLMVEAGEAAIQHHDEYVRNIQGQRNIQLDEIWSFCYAKQKRVASAKAAPSGAGDVWTWTALDSDSKLLVSWLVGSRESYYAVALAEDLRSRLEDRPQITSDRYVAYPEAIEGAFGADVDYAQLIKSFVAEEPVVETSVVVGKPDVKRISTSLVERQNLTMRMSMRRFTRETNGFSKKFQNHVYAVALHILHYNFCRVHMSLGTTPAVKAGLAREPYSAEWIVGLIDARTPAPGQRGPYGKRRAAREKCKSPQD